MASLCLKQKWEEGGRRHRRPIQTTQKKLFLFVLFLFFFSFWLVPGKGCSCLKSGQDRGRGDHARKGDQRSRGRGQGGSCARCCRSHVGHGGAVAVHGVDRLVNTGSLAHIHSRALALAGVKDGFTLEAQVAHALLVVLGILTKAVVLLGQVQSCTAGNGMGRIVEASLAGLLG